MTTPPSDRNFFDDSEDDSDPTPDFNLNNRFSGQEKSAQEHWDMIQDRLFDRWETPLPNPPENCADPLDALKPHVEEFGAESFYGCVFKSETHRLEHELIPESIWRRMAFWHISKRQLESDEDATADPVPDKKIFTELDFKGFHCKALKFLRDINARHEIQQKYKWNTEGTYGSLSQDARDTSADVKDPRFDTSSSQDFESDADPDVDPDTGPDFNPRFGPDFRRW